MRIVSITPKLDVLCSDHGSCESTGALFAGHGSRRVTLCRRLLVLIARKRWIPRAAARVPLGICSAEIAEALLARDPTGLDVGGVRWGAELREALRKRFGWPWLWPGSVASDASPGESVGGADPRVSIVLPTYNGVRYLSESIESCLNQSYRNLELLVVDDGSSADVRSVVSRFADARMRYFRHERNQGIAASLNTGFRSSRGEFLTWTSDDNYYEPHAIAEMLGFLSRYPNVDFVHAEYYEVTEDGAVTRLVRPLPASSLRINNFVGACFLYRRQVYERVGDYREVFLAEDYDYWIRVWRTSRMQRLFKPLYYLRMHPASLTERHSPKEVNEQVRQVKRMNRVRSLSNW